MLHDRTQRKLAEVALQKSEERFRVALENAPILVYTTDLDLRYTWIYGPKNGFSEESVIGKRDEELLPAKAVQELVQFKQSVLDRQEGAQAKIRMPYNGQIQTYNINAEPLRDAQGTLVGLTVAAIDITEALTLKAEMMRREERIEIQRRISQDYEEERARIARDLHDGPLQELISSNFLISSIVGEEDTTERERKLEMLASALENQAIELRDFCNELRPPALAPFGLEKAIRSHVEQVKERHPNLTIETDLEVDRRALPEDTRMILYRVYQEAMNNILKHAHATKVQVRFRFDEERAELELHDNGRGFTVPASWISLARQGHLGLVGMRERLVNIGGELQLQSAPGAGTTLHIIAPLGKH